MCSRGDWNVLVWKTVACLRMYPGIGPVSALQAVALSQSERAFLTELIRVNEQNDLQNFLTEVHRHMQTQTYRDTLVTRCR